MALNISTLLNICSYNITCQLHYYIKRHGCFTVVQVTMDSPIKWLVKHHICRSQLYSIVQGINDLTFMNWYRFWWFHLLFYTIMVTFNLNLWHVITFCRKLSPLWNATQKIYRYIYKNINNCIISIPFPFKSWHWVLYYWSFF